MSPTGTARDRSRTLRLRAVEALEGGGAFEAERLALKAVEAAAADGAWDALAETCPVLRDARMMRLAMVVGGEADVRIVTEAPTEESRIEPGCWLVQPPLVGADARRLRLAALQRDVPVAVICREPLTQLRLQPIVAIGQITIRTKVDPPDDADAPDIEWFTNAMRALGDAAIETIDPTTAIDRRVEQLLARLDSIPDHAGLHDALEETAREAARIDLGC